MKLRSKPKPPRAKEQRYEVDTYDKTLSQVIDALKVDMLANGYTEDEVLEYVSLDSVTISTKWDYDMEVAVAVVKPNESIKSLFTRVEQYEERLAQYNEWYAHNEDAIHEEKMKLADEKNQKEMKRINKEMKRLERKLMGLES